MNHHTHFNIRNSLPSLAIASGGGGIDIRSLFLLLAGIVAFTLGVTQAAEKPNIIFFLVDDMGWMDCGVYGSEYYETPNIDAFAKKGVQFTQAYAQPMCSPSRASLLSGQAVARHGITAAAGHALEVGKQLPPPATRKFMRPEQITLAEAMRDAGYATAHLGKWHLGVSTEHQPAAQGFDMVFSAQPSAGPPGKQRGGLCYFSPYGVLPEGTPTNRDKVGTITDGPDGEYITDRLTDEAIAFMNAHKEGPFFLNLWHYAVHGPWGAKEDYIEHFKDKQDPRGQQSNSIMAAMLRSVDESLGRILEELDRLGLAENTLVIFYSDNGGSIKSLREGHICLEDWEKWGIPKDVPPTSNAPLREGKGKLYEGGVRVPLLASWPGVIPAGRTAEAIVRSEDFYPTILDLAGVPKPAQQTLDGSSFAAVLRDPSLERDVPAFFPTQFGVAVRSGDWKLILNYKDKSHELYNLGEDLSETNNLAAQHPERVRGMFKQLEDHFISTGCEMRRDIRDVIQARSQKR
jgi:arylsulfatase A-like enzyme